jgi:hypothetical protein
MRRRRLLLVAGVLALLVAAWLCFVWLTPRPGAGITQEACKRLCKDMTESDVEVLFGCPAGNYSGKKADGLADEEQLARWTDEAEQQQEFPKRQLTDKAARALIAELLGPLEKQGLDTVPQSDEPAAQPDAPARVETAKPAKESAPPPNPLVTRIWVGEDSAVLVAFKDGKAVYWHVESVAEQQNSFLTKLRRMIPW